MKHLLLILVSFMFVSTYAASQSVRMLDENSYWEMRGQYLAGWPFYYMPVYFVKGTEEIDGKLYYRVCEDNTIDSKKYNGEFIKIADNYQDEGEGYTYFHRLSLREEDGKVYAHKSRFPKDDNTMFEQIGDEYLIFDFNLNEGDQFGLAPITVTKVEYYDSGDGVQRKMISFDSGHRILEGTGCVLGNFMYYLDEPLYMVIDEWGSYFKYLHSGKGWNVDGEMFPEDQLPTGVRNVSNEEEAGNKMIYDIGGRKATSVLSCPSIYIKDGKKHVNKRR